MWCRSASRPLRPGCRFLSPGRRRRRRPTHLTPLCPAATCQAPPTASTPTATWSDLALPLAIVTHGLLYTRSGGAQDLGLCPNWAAGLPAGGAVNVCGTTFTGVAVSSTTRGPSHFGHRGLQLRRFQGDRGHQRDDAVPARLNPTTHAKTWTMIPSQFVGSTYTKNETGQGATGVNAAGQVAGAGLGRKLGRVGPARRHAVCLFRRRPDEPRRPSGFVSERDDVADHHHCRRFGRGRRLPGRHRHQRRSGSMDAILYVAATHTIVDFGAQHRRQQHGHLSQRQQHLRDRRQLFADPAGRLDLQHQHPGPDHERSRRSRPMLRHQRQPDGHRSWRRVVRRHHSRRPAGLAVQFLGRAQPRHQLAVA